MKKALVPAVLVAIAAAALVVQLANKGSVRCEVCVIFKEQRQCATARADTRNEAAHAAQTSACSLIASGVSESFQCPTVAPESVACE